MHDKQSKRSFFVNYYNKKKTNDIRANKSTILMRYLRRWTEIGFKDSENGINERMEG